MYSISRESYEVMDGLKDDVSITVLMDKDDLGSSDYGRYVRILMEKYDEYSDRISIEYIDPYKNPSAIEQFAERSDAVAEGSIVVECGDQMRVLNLIDFYDTESDSNSGYTYVSSFRGESTLTSALLAVTSADTPHAYILRGHKECLDVVLDHAGVLWLCSRYADACGKGDSGKRLAAHPESAAEGLHRGRDQYAG